MSNKTFLGAEDNPCLPTIDSQQIVAESRLFKVEQLDLTFSNGETRQYERMKGSGRGAVMVVPIVNAEEFLLVSEYAAGTHSYEVGFPKGLIDPGETPEQAANRELQEEIGFGAKRFVKLKTLSTAPSYFSAKMHVFLAFDLYPASLEGDEPEPLTVVKCNWQDKAALIASEDFSEARSVTALLLAERYLQENS